MKGDQSIAQLSDQFGVHVCQLTAWKEQLQDGAADVFGPGTGTAAAAQPVDPIVTYPRRNQRLQPLILL